MRISWGSCEGHLGVMWGDMVLSMGRILWPLHLLQTKSASVLVQLTSIADDPLEVAHVFFHVRTVSCVPCPPKSCTNPKLWRQRRRPWRRRSRTSLGSLVPCFTNQWLALRALKTPYPNVRHPSGGIGGASMP